MGSTYTFSFRYAFWRQSGFESRVPGAGNNVLFQGGTMNERRTRQATVLVLASALGLWLSAPLRADDAAATFKAKCAACHGADGTGNTSIGKNLKIRDLTSAEVQKQTDEQLTSIITNGKAPAMPAFKDKLTVDQIKQLLAFIRQLAKK
jgi:cytochrome c6